MTVLLPAFDPVSKQVFHLLADLCGTQGEYLALQTRYFSKGVLTWARVLQQEFPRAHVIALQLMGRLLQAGDVTGAGKMLHPLLRYLAEELSTPGSRLTVDDGRVLVWGEHSSGTDNGSGNGLDDPPPKPYVVTLVPPTSPPHAQPEHLEPTCTCDRFMGARQFGGDPGVCSHLALVAIVVAVRGLRGLRTDALVSGNPNRVLLYQLYSGIKPQAGSECAGLPDEL